METRKTKSHSSLLSRTHSTTDLLPHTQSLHSKYSLYNAGAGITSSNLPAVRSLSRPGSSMPQSRIASRPMTARPASRQDQTRPSSRMMDSRIHSSIMMARPPSAKPGLRPCSAIRPLSGRVFMRRMEHGWVAKHYPESGPASQTDLNNELEDISDCESLDSFFDDDFDAQENSERLSNLLSCNSLGVESKGHKKDWNAGGVGIPKFHCPRCRDHWYGLTPFPCDEELARLIRDGLWYTGKGNSSKIPSHTKSGIQSGIPGGDGEDGSNGSNSFGDSRERKTNQSSKGEDGDREPWEMGRDEDKRNKKDKRRITFKLDDQDEGGNSKLDTTVDDSALLSKYNSGSTSAGHGFDNQNRKVIASVDDSGYSSSARDSKMDGLEADNSGLLEGSGSKNSVTKGRRRKGKGGKSGGSSSSGKRGKGSRTQLTDEVGMGLANALAEGPGLNGIRSEQTDLKLGQGSSRRGSLSSVTSSQSKTGPDHGKKVRKAGGYMRAVSPTGSEWGDPTHARPYASSTTASSHTENDSDNKDKAALPPIVSPITPVKKPMIDLSYAGRFEITPPWRFSYFSPSPLYTSAAQPTTTVSNKTRRRK